MPKAIIVGGSISGLFAALCLQKAGWAVEVHERTKGTLTGRGAGIVTQPELLDVMQKLGLDIRADFGIQVQERVLIDAAGDISKTIEMPQIVTAWDAIYALLRRSSKDIELFDDSAFIGIRHTANGVVAEFDGRGDVAADLLAGADGVRSTVRNFLWPETIPAFAGYVGWRCLADESRLPDDVRQQYFDRFCFHYPAGQQILSYPAAGFGNALEVGQRRLNIVWYRPVAGQAALERMLTDENGQLHPLGIPPPLIAKDVLRETMDAAAALPEPFRSAIQATEQLFFQPIYDVVSPNIVQGRIALLGDAAFTARPHAGAGVTKAAMDAACLAEELNQAGVSVDEALARYNAAQVAAGTAIISETCRLGTTIMGSTSHSPKRELEDNMADTATLANL